MVNLLPEYDKPCIVKFYYKDGKIDSDVSLKYKFENINMYYSQGKNMFEPVFMWYTDSSMSLWMLPLRELKYIKMFTFDKEEKDNETIYDYNEMYDWIYGWYEEGALCLYDGYIDTWSHMKKLKG